MAFNDLPLGHQIAPPCVPCRCRVAQRQRLRRKQGATVRIQCPAVPRAGRDNPRYRGQRVLAAVAASREMARAGAGNHRRCHSKLRRFAFATRGEATRSATILFAGHVSVPAGPPRRVLARAATARGSWQHRLVRTGRTARRRTLSRIGGRIGLHAPGLRISSTRKPAVPRMRPLRSSVPRLLHEESAGYFCVQGEDCAGES
ncbi:hypothetical protein B0G69_3823 [Paraburkholderia sp. RAU2J]|nr:hypothetical protein B0G69_3823 [Paraburkholderia sp. RAU2J]